MMGGLVFLTFNSFSQHRLEIEITDLRNDKGALMIQLIDIQHKVVCQKKEQVVNRKCTVEMEVPASGKYGVRYFHDENHSGKLETNIVGKPTEGYGFSNNARGKFGPPPFEKWLFDLSGDLKIELKTEY